MAEAIWLAMLLGTTVRLDGTTPDAKEKDGTDEPKPVGRDPVGIAVNPEGMLVRPPAAAVEIETTEVAAGADEELEDAAEEVTRVAS